jgi:ribosomal protein L24
LFIFTIIKKQIVKEKMSFQSISEFRRKRVGAEKPIESKVNQVVREKFVHSDQVVVKRGAQKGKYGYIKKSYPGAYLVKIDDMTTVTLNPKEVKVNDSELQIMHGKHASDKKYKFQYKPAHLDLNIMGRSVFDLIPEDVFYIDLVLKNGNYAEVTNVHNNMFDIVERVVSEDGIKDIKRVNVGVSEIKEYIPGFKANVLLEVEDEELVQELLENGEKEMEEQDDEFDENIEVLEYEDVQEEQEPEEAEAKSSFKDRDRISYYTEMTTEQKQNKNEVDKILNKLKMNIEMNYGELSDNIQVSIKYFENQIKKDVGRDENIKNTYIYKYIVAALVYYELVKSGHPSFTFSLGEYTKKLFDTNYFTEKDVSDLNNNMLLQSWGPLVLDKKRMISVINAIKSKIDIVQIMMNHADTILQSIFNLNMNTKGRKENIFELRPVGVPGTTIPLNIYSGRDTGNAQRVQIFSKYKEQIYSKLNVTDLLEIRAGIKDLPTVEVPIGWSQGEINLIEKFREKLMSMTASPEVDEEDKARFYYIIENLERAPYAIRDIDESQKEYKKYFDGIYNQILDRTKKAVGRKIRQLRKGELSKRREEISVVKTVDEDEVDAYFKKMDMEIGDTTAYKREKRLREGKKMIDDITRKVRNTKISSSTTEEEPEVKMGIVELSSMSADQLSEHISKMDIKDVKSLFKKRK